VTPLAGPWEKQDLKTQWDTALFNGGAACTLPWKEGTTVYFKINFRFNRDSVLMWEFTGTTVDGELRQVRGFATFNHLVVTAIKTFGLKCMTAGQITPRSKLVYQ
jgi:hypothetical protein